MINEERVKQLYKIALYEQNEEKTNRKVGQYYKSDYVGRQMIGSILTGTLAFACYALLWMLSSWEDVLESINNLEIVGIVFEMIIYYVLFMVLYLIATYIVYSVKYEAGKKKMKKYINDLKIAHKMYEREEKLKM